MTARILTLDQRDKAGELLTQVIGIVNVIGAASLGPDSTKDYSINNACWAAESLLEQLRAVLETGQAVEDHG